MPAHLLAEAPTVLLECLTVDVPIANGEKLSDFELQVTFDGGTFHPLGAGHPRADDLFRSIQYLDNHIRIMVVLIGNLQYSNGIFFPERAGEYLFRWKVVLDEENAGPQWIESRIIFAPTDHADLAFLQRIADSRTTKLLFGEDFFGRQGQATRERLLGPKGPDIRALMPIFELLEATRAREPGDVVRPRKSIENGLRWADSLFELAREFPDSSYAPYAAYYAGCCYLTAVEAAIKKVQMETGNGQGDGGMTGSDWQALLAVGRANPNYAKADEAMKFAVEKADIYLKPRALYMSAFVRGCTNNWEETERVLDDAIEAAPGDSLIEEMVEKLRRQLAIARERDEKTKSAEKSEP